MTPEKQFRAALISLPFFVVPLPLFLAVTFYRFIAPTRVGAHGLLFPHFPWAHVVMNLFDWYNPGLQQYVHAFAIGFGFWALAQIVRIALYFTLRKTHSAPGA